MVVVNGDGEVLELDNDQPKLVATRVAAVVESWIAG
jgi:hypothetical protein